MNDTRRLISGASLRDLIGLPYEAFDCYDLVKMFYRKFMSVELEDLLYRDTKDLHEMTQVVTIGKGSFVSVEEPEYGDVVLLRVWGMPAHVGIYLSSTELLHTQEKSGSVIERLSKWKKRIEGYYRWPSSN